MANYLIPVPFFLKKEGGLSKATTDAAHLYPSPCLHKGVYGWHTNKGVTWQTFKGNAQSLGYEASCFNFISMPMEIWAKIFKLRFWSFWDCDNIPYQSIADFMTWTVWGSGGGQFGKVKGSVGFLRGFLVTKGLICNSKQDVTNHLIALADQDEQKLWLDLIQYRWDWYSKLNQPANLNGWRNALDNYKKWGLENYSFLPKNDNTPISAVFFFLSSLFT